MIDLNINCPSIETFNHVYIDTRKWLLKFYLFSQTYKMAKYAWQGSRMLRSTLDKYKLAVVAVAVISYHNKAARSYHFHFYPTL